MKVYYKSAVLKETEDLKVVFLWIFPPPPPLAQKSSNISVKIW